MVNTTIRITTSVPTPMYISTPFQSVSGSVLLTALINLVDPWLPREPSRLPVRPGGLAHPRSAGRPRRDVPDRRRARGSSRGGLDVRLAAGEDDLLRLDVDLLDHPGRDHPLLAEDPEAGVDDDAAASGVEVGLVDLADVTVARVDGETGEVGRRALLGRLLGTLGSALQTLGNLLPHGPDPDLGHRWSPN